MGTWKDVQHQYYQGKWKWESFSCVQYLATPWEAARLLCPWNSPGKNTGVGSHSLLQGIFLTQGSNPNLMHCKCIFTVWATKSMMRYHLTSVRMTIFKKARKSKCLWECGEKGSWYSFGRNVNWCNHCGK